ncbi:synaptophysin-like isoform X2 [Varroa destructor]|uniref:MARVEL domain-containing protein n=1 Tax=Varroa destructor TaxID=109461 RepID=A0A7M7JTY3_VARDE|nr:synaptophysin-like isoform X2 [Varroa destructor]
MVTHFLPLFNMEMHFSALKEPRGFIRILQAVFAIMAFSITAGYSTTAKILIECAEFKAHVDVKFGYPFRMAYFPFDVPKDCSSTSRVDSHTVILPYNLSSNPEFFVACGVLSFMFCCAAVAVYVFRTALYQTNQTIPILDMGVTAVFTVFWFAGSCAWAQGVSDVKYYMSPDKLIERIPVCANLTAINCSAEEYGNYSSLNISVLLGFTNVMLWAFGTWFVYKDTAFHQQHQLPPGVPGSQYPPVGSNYPPQSPTQPQGQFQQPQY